MLKKDMDKLAVRLLVDGFEHYKNESGYLLNSLDDKQFANDVRDLITQLSDKLQDKKSSFQ